MHPPDNPNTGTDIKHDLQRLLAHGADAVDVVVFEDIRQMGGPLALSDDARRRIYTLALNDLSRQLNPYPQASATA